MSGDRYVVLGLAAVRATWPTDVARWSTSGLLPAEFVHCVSGVELRVRVEAGRAHSLAIVERGLPAVDRDLLDLLHRAGIPVVLIGSGPALRADLLDGVHLADVPTTPDQVGALLADHGRPIRSLEPSPGHDAPASSIGRWRGRLVAVTGQPGAGRSTLAAALAQHLAADARHRGDVVLADLALRAHQGLLHDAGDVLPGIQELAEAHRTGTPDAGALRRLQYAVPARGYRLLLGLRHPRDWTTLRPRALEAALDNLVGSTRVVVADTDRDLDGEAETGSVDVEDQHLLARATIARADVVVVAARPTVTGLHDLALEADALAAHGVAPSRILLALNGVPASPRRRAELARAVAQVVGGAADDGPIGPVHLPLRRNLDAVHHDVSVLPDSLVRPLGRAVMARLEELAPPAPPSAKPTPIEPGTLGLVGGSAP